MSPLFRGLTLAALTGIAAFGIFALDRVATDHRRAAEATMHLPKRVTPLMAAPIAARVTTISAGTLACVEPLDHWDPLRGIRGGVAVPHSIEPVAAIEELATQEARAVDTGRCVRIEAEHRVEVIELRNRLLSCWGGPPALGPAKVALSTGAVWWVQFPPSHI